MLRRGCGGVQCKGWAKPADKLWTAKDKLWMPGEQDGKTTAQRKSRPKAAFFLTFWAQAVSPSTVTVMSTTTSVCSATETVLSPTTLIGPLGMRTCALATL